MGLWIVLVLLVVLLLLVWVGGAFHRAQIAWKEAETGPGTAHAETTAAQGVPGETNSTP